MFFLLKYFKGGKGMGGMEGGIRIPGIIRWPERIESGSVTNLPISLLDFMPTVMDLVVGETNEEKV